MVKEVMEGKPVIITYLGKPAAAITSLNEDVGSCMLGAGCCELGNSSDPTDGYLWDVPRIYGL